jgi:phosphate-selective porin OprO/OprP
VIGQPGKERLTWAAGIFKETDENPGPSDNDENRGFSVTSRVTGVPYLNKGGRRLVHVGLGYSHRDPDGGPIDYRTRAESRIVEARYVDPNLTVFSNDTLPDGAIRLNDTNVRTIDLLDAEFAGVVGPWWWQAEYLHSFVDTETEGSLNFQGYYVQTGYVLTGEKRNYNHGKGTFTPPTPKKNFNPFGDSKGWGAWEVAGRYSVVDMDDGPIEGGKHTAYTLGLNWYANQNIRWALNFIHNDIDNEHYDGDFQTLQSRVQIAF